MTLQEKCRSWLRQPSQPLADNKMDWAGIIVVGAAAVFSVGVILFLSEMDSAFRFRLREVTLLYLLKKYPLKIFLLTPLTVFYAVTRRKYCRTNAGRLQLYAAIGGLLLLSLLAVRWEVLNCVEEWGRLPFLLWWGG